MAKFTQGDIVVITDHIHGEGVICRVENWRGGRVAPYVVRILESDVPGYPVGEIRYKAGRDMELRYMEGKRKVWCSYSGCRTYSFEGKGTIVWRCCKHLSADCEPSRDEITLSEKVDLILDHLGLDVVIEPRRAVLAERSDDTDKGDDEV